VIDEGQIIHLIAFRDINSESTVDVIINAKMTLESAELVNSTSSLGWVEAALSES
jgi:hypothetical protein